MLKKLHNWRMMASLRNLEKCQELSASALNLLQWNFCKLYLHRREASCLARRCRCCEQRGEIKSGTGRCLPTYQETSSCVALYFPSLLAPPGAQVVIMVYYVHTQRSRTLFQILQILKCSKDPTCAIFLKSMGFKDIK